MPAQVAIVAILYAMLAFSTCHGADALHKVPRLRGVDGIEQSGISPRSRCSNAIELGDTPLVLNEDALNTLLPTDWSPARPVVSNASNSSTTASFGGMTDLAAFLKKRTMPPVRYKHNAYPYSAIGTLVSSEGMLVGRRLVLTTPLCIPQNGPSPIVGFYPFTEGDAVNECNPYQYYDGPPKSSKADRIRKSAFAIVILTENLGDRLGYLDVQTPDAAQAHLNGASFATCGPRFMGLDPYDRELYCGQDVKVLKYGGSGCGGILDDGPVFTDADMTFGTGIIEPAWSGSSLFVTQGPQGLNETGYTATLGVMGNPYQFSLENGSIVMTSIFAFGQKLVHTVQKLRAIYG
ncbi:uncharacterized protein B0I36DRAFT_355972 [Microdochium trichocladiopsis]|uniref:Trypsin-like cysteine/serine peptidase domain-containing protein n=1 Tax=Microdochium trichocladiopsis TaxID=1682393 RepID=A0A9P9BFR9_9PEZI|nr:uncharacterized protein B0I36DRAFT_355972 [Microdochium trichocladiopsis]KAH7012576.1 hypothetical protein B0I36DRAFT_355972 [Microdochium trichocladiopsis]